MNKKFNFTKHEGYSADAVINRGYAIYDEWQAKRFSSRKIVSYVELAVFEKKQNKKKTASTEALSCLFAIDMRIKEKYNTLLRCIFLYFSWNRETRALKLLRSLLKFSSSEKDIRTAIEIELQGLREKLETEKADNGDDETSGGKRNGKAEEEATLTEEKEQEQAPEQKTDEIADSEESKETSEKTAKENAKEISEQELKDESIKESAEKQQTYENPKEEYKINIQEKTEQVHQEKSNKFKEENNGPDEASDPSKDKPNEVKSYNDAGDYPLIYNDNNKSSDDKLAADTESFIDVIIMDNMVKGDKKIIGYQRTAELERNNESDIPQDTVVSQNEKNKSTGKDAYLYDKMIATDKGESKKTLNVESTKQAEKVSVSEAKTEQPKETIQNNDNANSAKQEFKPLSEMPQSDNLNVDLDNDIAYALNAHMSLESKMALIQMKEEQLREHMNITLEELGMNDTSNVLRVTEPQKTNQTSIAPNIK